MPINFPNILTIIRILITPLFVILLLRNEREFALLTFTVAAISDGLDGFIARVFNQRTELGAYLDPIADKLLMTAAFVSLGVLKIIPSWLTVIVISRDVLIVLGLALFTMTEIKVEIKPSIISKNTTVAQLSTIIWVLLDLEFAIVDTVSISFYWITACLTITSGLHYMYTGINRLQSD
mgnify:CR=1 FL=1